MYGENHLSEAVLGFIEVVGDGMGETVPSPENGTVHYEIEILRDGDGQNGKNGVFL